MSWLLSCLLALFPAGGKEFLHNLQKTSNLPCQDCQKAPALSERKKGDALMVFISFSVPAESWKDLSSQLEKTEGTFVIRGIPDHSFEQLAAALTKLGASGVKAPIDIDPEAFEKYGIDQTPAIVLEEGGRVDKIVGNLRLDAALRILAEGGETAGRAQEILALLERGGA